MRATFIGKYYGTGFDRNNVYLEYEYRGMTYTVMENRAKGNEPLSWQHISEQSRIDQILDMPQTTKSEPIDFDEIWELMGWNE